jgi:putative NIF3 family GTP cyclohydrolase 1 type 2
MAALPTVGEIITMALATVPGAPFPDTVDTLKSGELTRPVTGIATTFLATMDVIERAAALGANFIITHEPTFYNHLDATAWLEGDAVFAAKAKLLADHDIAVWRFHDHWHAHQPDGIMTGVLAALGWEQFQVLPDPWVTSAETQARLAAIGMPWAAAPGRSWLCEIPELTLAELADQLKERLGIGAVRVAGPEELACRRVALLPGSPPGQFQMIALGRDDVDVLVTGEINEWEACEYVRDANRAGRPRGLIVLGHAASEEAGMGWLATWLQQHWPDLTVTHIPTGEPLRVR